VNLKNPKSWCAWDEGTNCNKDDES